MTPDQLAALDKAHLYIREAETGFLLLEANSAQLQAEAIAHLRDSFPVVDTLFLDAESIPDTNPFPELAERIRSAPEAKIVFIQGLHTRTSGHDEELALIRALNLNRDTLANLQRMLVCVLPAYFVDLIYRYAQDFKDYTPVIIRLSQSLEVRPETAMPRYFTPADDEVLGNRASFLQDKLRNNTAPSLQRLQILIDLAKIHEQVQQYALAGERYCEAVRLARKLDEPRLLAVCLRGQGEALYVLGEPDEALTLHEEELKIYEELGDRRSRAVTLGDIARIYVDKGRVDEALELQQQRLGENISLGDKDGMASACLDLASIYTALRHFGTARPLADRAFTLFVEIGRVEGIAYAGARYGQLLLEHNNTKQALDVLGLSKDAFIQVGQTRQASSIEAMIQQVQPSRSSAHATKKRIKRK